MSTYICRDCGETFDEPKHYTERHGLETGPYEELTCCPFCGGSYEKAVACECCGRLIPESEACIAENPDGVGDLSVCSDCADELAVRAAEAEADEPSMSDESSTDTARMLQRPSASGLSMPGELSSSQSTLADDLARCIEAVYAEPITQDSQLTKVMRPTLDSAWLLDRSPLGHLILNTLRHCDPDSEQSWCLTGYDPTAKLLTERALDHLVIDSVLDTHVIPGHWRPLVARALAQYATARLYDQPSEAEHVLAAATLMDPSVLLPYPTTVCDLQGVVTARPGEPETVLEELADETLHALNHDLHIAEAQHMPILIQVGSHVYCLPGDALTCEEVSDVCWSSTHCKAPKEAHD